MLHHLPQVVPWNSQLKPEEHDAFFLSNGPGDPQVLLSLPGQKYPNWISNVHFWLINLHLCIRQPSGGSSLIFSIIFEVVESWSFGASSLHIDIDWQTCAATVAELKKLLTSPNPKPIFGICLGHQVGWSVDDDRNQLSDDDDRDHHYHHRCHHQSYDDHHHQSLVTVW